MVGINKCRESLILYFTIDLIFTIVNMDVNIYCATYDFFKAFLR